LAGGADGVLITGCHPGECHYLEQNYKALRRVVLLKSMLTQFGIDPGRVKLVWASAAEGVRLAAEITTMVEEVRALGPLNWPAVSVEEMEIPLPPEAEVVDPVFEMKLEEVIT
jgi:F420-non-reducing hydrogenase iron-sulfur subunit